MSCVRMICSNCGIDFPYHKYSGTSKECPDCYYFLISYTMSKQGIKCFLPKPKNQKRIANRRFFNCKVIDEDQNCDI